MTGSSERTLLTNSLICGLRARPSMSTHALVVTSPVAGTTEAIAHERTGLVAPVEDAAAWVAAWRRLGSDDALCERLRTAARAWVQENFDVRRNAASLLARLRQES